MEGLAQALDALLKQGILPAAFIIGAIAFFIALIGKIPTGNGHDIPPIPRFLLGFFGFVFAFTGLGGALFGIFAVTNNPPSQEVGPVIITATPEQTSTNPREVVIVTATLPPSPILQPTHTSQTITTSRTRVGTIEVLASSENGAAFTCSDSGRYQLVLEEGVYSPWREGLGGQWRTFVYAYVNHEIVWERNQHGYIAPAPVGTSGQDMASVGRMETQTNDTRDAAAQRGQSTSADIYCQSSQLIRFITMDERGAYGDNFGSVTIGIYFLGG